MSNRKLTELEYAALLEVLVAGELHHPSIAGTPYGALFLRGYVKDMSYGSKGWKLKITYSGREYLDEHNETI